MHMPSSMAGDNGVVVTYTVLRAGTPTTSVPAAKPVPQPVVSHGPLPITGAPVAIEMMASFGLLLAGAIAAIAARRSIPRTAR